MVYGIVIAGLSIAGSGIVAVIGAMVLGLLWTARSMFMKRPS